MVGRGLCLAWSCLRLMLVCVVYRQVWAICRLLSQRDPVANAVGLSLLRHVLTKLRGITSRTTASMPSPEARPSVPRLPKKSCS
jgi:hypothetical protein